MSETVSTPPRQPQVERSDVVGSQEPVCALCGGPRDPRKRETCSDRCRAALSRQRRLNAREARDERVRRLRIYRGKEELMGQLYQRGRIWWVKYYVNGRPIRESTGTAKEKEAERFLKAREGRAAAGLPLLPRADRVRWEEAAADLRGHYEATGSRDLAEYDRRVKHLTAFFTGSRIAGIGQADVDKYVLKRRAVGVTDSTIRRELGTLVTLLRFAYRSKKLARLPLLTRPKEGEARVGFVERADFEAIRRHLPADLQVVVTVAYTLGWRKQEVLRLERRHLNLETGELRLDAAMTKTKKGREAHLTPELRRLLSEQIAQVEVLQRKLGRIVPWLFPNLRGSRVVVPGVRRTVLGERIRSFRRAWATACRKAGRPGLLIHDLRRSGVRNMVRAGIPERVAMSISGHKTRSVFDRYNIVSETDLREAARRLDGHNSGTIGTLAVESPSATPR